MNLPAGLTAEFQAALTAASNADASDANDVGGLAAMARTRRTKVVALRQVLARCNLGGGEVL